MPSIEEEPFVALEVPPPPVSIAEVPPSVIDLRRASSDEIDVVVTDDELRAMRGGGKTALLLALTLTALVAATVLVLVFGR